MSNTAADIDRLFGTPTSIAGEDHTMYAPFTSKLLAAMTLLSGLIGATLFGVGEAAAGRGNPKPFLIRKTDAKSSLPDLAVTDVVLASPQSLRVTVRNLGKTQAKNTTVKVTLSGGKGTMMEWIPPLKAGETKMVMLQVARPLGSDPVHATVQVDPSNYVQESNEANNTFSARLMPRAAPPMKKLPDLVVTEKSGTGLDFVAVTVKNIGAGPALKQSRLELRIYSDLGGMRTIVGVRLALIPVLNPGQSYTASIPLELPAGYIYDFVVATVDVRNDVMESNEMNNER